MKDAFGGAFILRIMIIFFIVFISFMVVAVDFAKTYRVKNGVINILERNVISDEVNVDSIKSKVEDYLKKDVKYRPALVPSIFEKISSKSCKINATSGYVSGNVYGVCIEPVVDSGSTSYYYRVTAYMVVESSFLNFNVPIPIKGETRIISNMFD